MTFRRSLLIAFALTLPASASDVANSMPKRTVCDVHANARRLTGKRVRVEGYIFDLMSHGIVLAPGRHQCSGLLGLEISEVEGKSAWKRFDGGPMRATLVGTVMWEPARLGGFNPALKVERVESLARKDSPISAI